MVNGVCMDDSAKRYGFAALGLTLAFLAYRLILLAGFPYDLHGDEAQYWTWAQEPAFGYYSKPPMIAWLIMATTSICGDGLACVKISSPILHAGTGMMLFLCGRELYGARAGFWSSTTYTLMPAVSLSAVVITTDAPLLFFWSVALYAFIRSIRDDRTGWWILTGLAGGLGLLSKYNMGIFAVSALAFLLWDTRYRHLLLKPGPWLAAAIAAIVYAPNLLWNATHGFISYQHTTEISQASRANFDVGGLLDFLLSQFAVFGPVSLLVLAWLIVRIPTVSARVEGRLTYSFALPWLTAMIVLAFASRVFANWSAPAYIAATLLVTGELVRIGKGNRLLLAILITNAVLTAGIYHYEFALQVVGIDLTRQNDPFKRVRGWQDLGKQTSAIVVNHPALAVLTEERMLTAELMYYMSPRREILKWNPDNRRDDHYDISTSLASREGQDFLFVTRNGVSQEIASRFASHQTVGEIRVAIYEDWRLDYDVWVLRNFKGY